MWYRGDVADGDVVGFDEGNPSSLPVRVQLSHFQILEERAVRIGGYWVAPEIGFAVLYDLDEGEWLSFVRGIFSFRWAEFFCSYTE